MLNPVFIFSSASLGAPGSAHLCSLRLVAHKDAVEGSSELPGLRSVRLQPTFHHISGRGGHPGNGPWQRGESRLPTRGKSSRALKSNILQRQMTFND